MIRWFQRNCICFKTVSGESGDINVQEDDNWKTKLQQMIKSKKPPKTFLIQTKQVYFIGVPRINTSF